MFGMGTGVALALWAPNANFVGSLINVQLAIFNELPIANDQCGKLRVRCPLQGTAHLAKFKAIILRHMVLVRVGTNN